MSELDVQLLKLINLAGSRGVSAGILVQFAADALDISEEEIGKRLRICLDRGNIHLGKRFRLTAGPEVYEK